VQIICYDFNYNKLADKAIYTLSPYMPVHNLKPMKMMV